MKTHEYVKEMPEGYRYCNECELLTPSYLGHDEIPMPEDFKCCICDSSPDGYSTCPNCGWEHDPDRDIKPEIIKVKRHTTLCLDQQRIEWDKKIYPESDFFIDDNNCNCPEVDVYPIQNIFNYRTFSQYWNMECSNAIEWSYDIMCPICNEVFGVEDGNC